jgi:hypothetical protein
MGQGNTATSHRERLSWVALNIEIYRPLSGCKRYSIEIAGISGVDPMRSSRPALEAIILREESQDCERQRLRHMLELR